MGFDDEPNLATFGDAEGVAGGERELHQELDLRVGSGLHAGEDDDVATFDGEHFSWKNITRANLFGFSRRQENVASTDGDAESAARGGANERGFQNECGVHRGREISSRYLASRYFASRYFASRYL